MLGRHAQRRITAILFFSLAACEEDRASRRAVTPTATRFPTATNPPSPTDTSTPRPPATPIDTPTATATDVATVPATAAPSSTATDTPAPTGTAAPSATPAREGCDDPEVRAREPLCELDHAAFPCEGLIQAKCLLPYPSLAFLRDDPSTTTGLRVEYPRQAMPANGEGVRVDPAEWNRLDGFSPASLVVAFFPEGVDLAASRVPTITGVARSLEPDSPTVIYDAQTGRRVPHFAELDAGASSPAGQALLLRTAVRLRDQGLYIVAIRGLVDRDGDPVAPPRAFRILRDRLATPVRAIERRRERHEHLFSLLEAQGIERASLLLAWDFVTASGEALHGRALAVRDQGLEANGPGAPPFEIIAIEEEVNERVFRRVRGRFEVPLFLNGATPPAFLNLHDTGVPRQNGTVHAPFVVTIPRSAVAGGIAAPSRPVLFGHGLYGNADELDAEHLQQFQDRFNVALAATDWIGMAGEDLAAIESIGRDLSLFPALPDRLQQAMLNSILLGRLLTAQDGLVSHRALQLEGVPLITTGRPYFYGAGWGAVAGATYMALTPDTIRAVLVAGAANHSLLLERSIAFAPLRQALRASYPDDLDQPLVLALLQQLWDRADPQSYLPHLIDDPLSGTPPKRLLLQAALHDSQMTNVATEIAARSLAIAAVAPSVVPWFQIRERQPPFDGSAVALYDLNGTPAPLTNVPPATDNGVHDALLRLDAAQRQADAFLRPDGRVESFCDGPCFFRDLPGVDQRDVRLP